MSKKLGLEERLIVALDFEPDSKDIWHARWNIRHQVLAFAESLRGVGVYVKVNAILRACGYELIEELRKMGLRVFADLKLHDISHTLATDGKFLRAARPEILTVMCNAGTESMRKLKEMLPDTEVLGVTVLTSVTEEDAEQIHGTANVGDTVVRLAHLADKAGIDGLIASPREATVLRSQFGNRFTINTPGIRPLWALVPGDDQKRVMTPEMAIRAGADRIVVGRPVLEAKDSLVAVRKVLGEIEMALETG